jgi:hypothetical protein
MASTFATNIAAALADVLRKVVPADFIVSGAEGVLEVRPRGPGLGSRSDLGAIVDQSPSEEGVVHSAGLCALNAVQDFVSVTSGRPWPVDSARGLIKMADSQVAIENRRLRLWYGDPDRIVVDVGTIDLDGAV